MLLKTLIGAASPAGPRACLTVLIYHRVLPEPDPWGFGLPDRAVFDRQLKWLKSWFNVLPLSDAVDRLASGSLPARAAAITFDDGYADNVTCALPILKRHGLHATFFIASGFLDGGIMWNDRIIQTVQRTQNAFLDCSVAGMGRIELNPSVNRARIVEMLLNSIKHLPYTERNRAVDLIVADGQVELPTDLMMTSTQLRELHSAGMGVGGHTVTHPILACMEDTLVYREIEDGKRRLENIIGTPLDLFAYPNGKPGRDYRPHHVEMVRELGFKAAVTTVETVAQATISQFEIPRFLPWEHDCLRFGGRMVGKLLSKR